MATNTNDMLLIHRVLHRELAPIPGLVRAAAGDPGKATRLAKHLTELLGFLHLHHSGEDELLYPLLRERLPESAALFALMDSQHGGVDDAVGAMRADLTSWGSTADAAAGERIAAGAETLSQLLRDHLSQEEAEVLPIAAATVSQEEWDKLGDHGFGGIPGKRRLITLARILEDTTEGERKEFLKVVPPPARLAYKLIGIRQLAKENAALRR